MPLLYKYEFDIGDGFTVLVAFYDTTYNIIAAESLAQISSATRRIWAQKIILKINKDTTNDEPLCLLNASGRENSFQQRLLDENWGDAVIKLIESDACFTLQIYRLYSFL